MSIPVSLYGSETLVDCKENGKQLQPNERDNRLSDRKRNSEIQEELETVGAKIKNYEISWKEHLQCKNAEAIPPPPKYLSTVKRPKRYRTTVQQMLSQ